MFVFLNLEVGLSKTAVWDNAAPSTDENVYYF